HLDASRLRVKGLDEGILQDILAIDRRSRHACAVAMKAWPQPFQATLEFICVHGLRPCRTSCPAAAAYTSLLSNRNTLTPESSGAKSWRSAAAARPCELANAALIAARSSK